MVKRKTRVQREAERKAALLQRVTDIYAGAGGRVWDADDFATAADLSRIIPVLQAVFSPQLEAKYPWLSHYLDNFNDPRSAADFLYGEGFRA